MGNDTGGARKLFLDHRNSCSKKLAILEEELNVLAGRTYWKNMKVLIIKDNNLTPPM